jgi:hypothetical protein
MRWPGALPSDPIIGSKSVLHDIRLVNEAEDVLLPTLSCGGLTHCE